MPHVRLGEHPGVLLLPGLGEDRWTMMARWGLRLARAGSPAVAVDLPGVGALRHVGPTADRLRTLETWIRRRPWRGVLAVSYGAVLLVEGWLAAPAHWWVLLSPARVSGSLTRYLPRWTRWQVQRRLGGLPAVPSRKVDWPDRVLVVLAGKDRVLPPVLGWAAVHRIPSQRLDVRWYPRASHTVQAEMDRLWEEVQRWVQGNSSG